MSRISPHATLALLLIAALTVLVAGIGFARREQTARIERDREPLRQFAGDLQHELHRLDRLYESNLERTARTAPLSDSQGIWRVCAGIVGVRQFSMIHASADRGIDSHLAIEQPAGAPWPEPAFLEKAEGLPHARVLLSEHELFAGREDSGWIDEPGKPLMFWHRRLPDECVVLLIDVGAVSAAIEGNIGEWCSRRFEPLRVAGGPDQLLTPADRALITVGKSGAARADFLLPLRTRFGVWQLASWDRYETRVSYRLPALAAGAALSALVALLGFFVSGSQRRSLQEAADRVSFVNSVSHELRTPLTNILLNVDLAADALGHATEPARRLALVQEEARRLGRLIDNVLTFSRHEQGKLRTEPRACVPAGVIAAVVEQFAPSFARRTLSVRRIGDAGTACLLDADAFAQILSNLLSNVEKYVPGGVLEIATALSDSQLTVTVTDEGPGIPAAAAERIFRPFERLGSRVNEGSSGTGLGLGIARDLAASMGGSLVLLPSERGACFALRVPAPRVQSIASVA